MELKSLCQVFDENHMTTQGVFFVQSQGEDKYLSYQGLYTKALKLLYFLQVNGVEAKQELVFQIENNEDFVSLFWACLLGGIIPVPLSVGNNDEHRLKLFKIWKVLNRPHLIADAKVLKMLEDFGSESNLTNEMEKIKSHTILLDKFNHDLSTLGTIHPSNLNDIAFIQFSSGSTGDPKGVVVTHDNLLTNIYAMINCAKISSNDISFSWMPLTHDMGLIGFHLLGVVAGINQINMPTPIFIRHPSLWFKKVNEYKASVLYSPNFGFKHFLSFFDHKIATDWDFSKVRIIFNGAEPISAELCDVFLEEMGKHGMNKNAMYPVYGMAEATLATTFPIPGEEYTAINVDRRFLNIGEPIRELERQSQQNNVMFVDVGYPVDNCFVRITDNENRILGDNTVGNIQISGKNVTQGYYNNAEATRKTITEDGWLNTGDLGFTRNRRLVVTGRAKDIIFVRGQNYYPHDIERVAEEVEGIELGKVAACGIFNSESQTEEVCLFFLFKKQIEDSIPLIIDLKRLIHQKTGLQVFSLIPIKKMPKTTSGKIQRYKLAESFQNGEFAFEHQKIAELLHKVRTDPETRPIYTQTEKNLVNVCEEILKITEIGIHGNFTDFGVDSVKLNQIHGKLEGIYPGKVMEADFFAYPTIAKLAGFIDRGGFISITPLLLPIDYFSGRGEDKDNSSFEFKLHGAMYQRITTLSNKMNIAVSDILLSIYTFLLAEISGNKEITIQAMVKDTDRIISLNASLHNVTDSSSLFSMVSSIVRDDSAIFGYSIHDLDRIKLNKDDSAAIPLFYKKNLLNTNTELLQVFDLIFEIHEDYGCISFVVDYNKRLKKDKMRELVDSYVKMLDFLTENVTA